MPSVLNKKETPKATERYDNYTMRKSSATFAAGSEVDGLDLGSGDMSPTPLNVDLKHPIDEQPQL